jgi:hypothetical protein
MTARHLLMVEPKNFISNPQTAGDNFFQQATAALSEEDLSRKTKKEFDALVKALEDADVEVTLFRQDDALNTPDAIYPNNWFSTLPGGTLVLYPMMAENRRLERRAPLLDYLRKKYGKVINLYYDEDRGIYLEGTGSLVIDHRSRIAYASLSQRTSSNMIFEWCRLTGYDVVIFTSYDRNGEVIYHTNVMMCVAENFAIVCLEAMEDEDARDRVRKSLNKTGHEIIEITLSQVHHFCGNCLELENNKGEKLLLMSAQAFFHFSEEQRNRIEKYCSIIYCGLDTIEAVGGGGARCMVAELF